MLLSFKWGVENNTQSPSSMQDFSMMANCHQSENFGTACRQRTPLTSAVPGTSTSRRRYFKAAVSDTIMGCVPRQAAALTARWVLLVVTLMNEMWVISQTLRENAQFCCKSHRCALCNESEHCAKLYPPVCVHLCCCQQIWEWIKRKMLINRQLPHLWMVKQPSLIRY